MGVWCTTKAIADTLKEDKVLIPSAYQEKHHPENARMHAYYDPFLWTNTTVSYILDHQEYLGHTVFVDKIVVHAATGGRTTYRQQKIDIYFNFIGCCQPPAPVISEEDRIAAIDERRRTRTREKQRRRAARYAEKMAALREAAKTDPEAAAQYERFRQSRREAGRRYRQKKKETKLVSET